MSEIIYFLSAFGILQAIQNMIVAIAIIVLVTVLIRRS